MDLSTYPQYVEGDNYTVPPDFQYLTQPIWYLLKNGTVAPPITFNILDNELFYATQWSVVYGCCIGAAVMTLLHVVALTPLTKRRTLIFWLNVVGLCQVLIRGIIQSLHFTRDRFATYYVNMSGDSTSVPPLHRVHSTLSVILSLTSITTVEVIFFVQGRAILSSLPRVARFFLLSFLVFFGLVAITVRLIYGIFNIQDIWIWNYIAYGTTNIPQWCEPASKLLYNLALVAFILTCSQSLDYLCDHHRCLVLRLDLFHWKTDLPALEDEYHAGKELRRYECALPCRHSVHDSPKYVQFLHFCHTSD